MSPSKQCQICARYGSQNLEDLELLYIEIQYSLMTIMPTLCVLFTYSTRVQIQSQHMHIVMHDNHESRPREGSGGGGYLPIYYYLFSSTLVLSLELAHITWRNLYLQQTHFWIHVSKIYTYGFWSPQDSRPFSFTISKLPVHMRTLYTRCDHVDEFKNNISIWMWYLFAFVALDDMNLSILTN